MSSTNTVAVWLGEAVARRTDRRSFLGRVSQAAFAGTAALAVGAGLTVPAYAQCQCSYPHTNWCGSGCPNAGGCPSGCSFCTQGQEDHCRYPTGYWTVNCGSCFIYCSDCWCNSSVCGCTSACIPTRPAP